jgi:hypothetical protein
MSTVRPVESFRHDVEEEEVPLIAIDPRIIAPDVRGDLRSRGYRLQGCWRRLATMMGRPGARRQSRRAVAASDAVAASVRAGWASVKTMVKTTEQTVAIDVNAAADRLSEQRAKW